MTGVGKGLTSQGQQDAGVLLGSVQPAASRPVLIPSEAYSPVVTHLVLMHHALCDPSFYHPSLRLSMRPFLGCILC